MVNYGTLNIRFSSNAMSSPETVLYLFNGNWTWRVSFHPFSFFELKQIHSEARDETEICNRLYIGVLIVLSPGISDLLERNAVIRQGLRLPWSTYLLFDRSRVVPLSFVQCWLFEERFSWKYCLKNLVSASQNTWYPPITQIKMAVPCIQNCHS